SEALAHYSHSDGREESLWRPCVPAACPWRDTPLPSRLRQAAIGFRRGRVWCQRSAPFMCAAIIASNKKRSNESGYSGWIVGNPEVGIPELVTSGLPVTRQQHGINPITEQSVIVRQNRNLIGADTHSFNLSSSSKKHRTA